LSELNTHVNNSLYANAIAINIPHVYLFSLNFNEKHKTRNKKK